MNDIDRKIAEIEGWAYSIMFRAWERGRITDSTFERVKQYRPSTDWADGGPLIEKYEIKFVRSQNGKNWEAIIPGPFGGIGETHLIAAMKAIIASKEEG